MRCFCPYCGGRIPGRPRVNTSNAMHCSEKLLWWDNKAFRSREDIEKHLAAVLSTEKQPFGARALASSCGNDSVPIDDGFGIHLTPSSCGKGFSCCRLAKVTAASSDLCIFCAPGMARSLGPDGARLLVKHATKSRGLRLNRLAALDPETALILSTCPGDLHLNGIKSLVPEVAESLSQHRGALFLNGVTEISVAAAEQLIKHIGRIDMLGLDPSPSTASALSRHREINLSSNARAIMTAESVWRRTVRRQVKDHPRATPASSKRPAQRRSASAELRVLTPEIAKRLAASQEAT